MIFVNCFNVHKMLKLLSNVLWYKN